MSARNVVGERPNFPDRIIQVHVSCVERHGDLGNGVATATKGKPEARIMVPKSQAIVGLEIGALVVRAVQTDREAKKLEDYVEVAVELDSVDETKPKEPYQRAIDSAIEQLNLNDPETYRLGVAFSDLNAGVGNGPDMTEWLTQQVQKLDVSFVYVGAPEVSFSPDNVVNDVLALFRPSGVAVSRMELSPVATARVLPGSLTAAILLGSGIGWQIDLRAGKVFSAFSNETISRTQALKMVSDGDELPPLTALRDIEVPNSLLSKHSIPVALLAPAAGVAKGIANREAENLLYGEKIEAASEVQRREARKSTTGRVQAVPEAAALAGQPTKTTKFQPLNPTSEQDLLQEAQAVAVDQLPPAQTPPQIPAEPISAPTPNPTPDLPQPVASQATTTKKLPVLPVVGIVAILVLSVTLILLLVS